MKLRKKRNPNKNDILESVLELRVVVNNTLQRMIELLKSTKFIKFGRLTDEMRADDSWSIGLLLVPQRGFYIPYIMCRLQHVLTQVNRENITLNQLIQVCEWIPKIKVEIKIIWLRIKETLEYLEDILLAIQTSHVGRNIPPRSIATFVEVDENRYLNNVMVHMNHNMNPIHKAFTMSPSKLSQMLDLWKDQFKHDTEQVARILSKIESRRARWYQDDHETEVTRRNAADALLALRGNGL